MAFSLSEVLEPIVLAPLGGGPATPALAAAVCNAGGLGFLAAGYNTADACRGDLAALRSLTDRPFGINLFVPSPRDADEAAIGDYVGRLARDAKALGAGPGEPRWDDDDWSAKLDLVVAERVPVVSFTFGCPSREVIARLRGAGIAVWVTVTDPEEARIADAADADALVLQGIEAGGHRASFVDGDGAGDLGLLALIRAVAQVSRLPLVAAGGIADGAGIAAVLVAGASAAALGTAFLRTDEAGTSAPHRRALAAPERTALTRAFTGRLARGIVNRFMREYGAHAPSGYPQIHHATAPIRAAARKAGDAELINLWAGQALALARGGSAVELMRRLSREWRECLRRAAEDPRLSRTAQP